jgi:hypothetical protein
LPDSFFDRISGFAGFFNQGNPFIRRIMVRTTAVLGKICLKRQFGEANQEKQD